MLDSVIRMQRLGAALLVKLEKMIINFRQQNFFVALSTAKTALEELAGYLEGICAIDYSGTGIDISGAYSELEMYLNNVLEAQVQGDYILLADLYEIGIIPGIIKIQSNFASYTGNVVRSEVIADTCRMLKERNMAELAEYIAENADRFDMVSGGIVIEPAADGEYTAAYEKDGLRKYLHSNNKPSVEAYTQACYYADERKKYVMYGLGLGYGALELLGACTYSRVTVYESSREMVLAAALYGVLYELLCEERFELVCAPVFYALKQIEAGEELCIHKNSIELVKSKESRELLEDYFVQFSSIRAQGRLLDGNFEYNKENFDAHVDELHSVIRGKDVYLIAAGPSLDKNVDELKRLEAEGKREKSLIICAGTVLRKLTGRGIIPDYVMITDANKETYAQIKGLEECGVPLIGLSTAYHEVFKKYKGMKYFVCQKGYDRAEKFAKEHKLNTYDTGGSVMTTIFDIAIRLNAGRIIFVGLDLAYTGGYNHASETNNYEKANLAGAIYVDGYYGNKIETGRTLNIYRKWFENRLKADDVGIVINATEGGADIKGMIKLPLARAVDKKTEKKDGDKVYLLLKGASQYDALRVYLDELAAGIEAAGRKAVVIDGLKDNFDKELENTLKKQEFEAFITCNGMLMAKKLLKEYDTTFCTMIFEQPAILDERLKQADMRTMIISCDGNHAEYAKTYYDNIGYAGFMPLSGSYISDLKPYEERRINLLFTGSYMDSEDRYKYINAMPENLRLLAREVIEYIIANPSNSCEQGLKHVLRERGREADKKTFNQLMFHFNFIEYFMRAYFRNKVFETILGAGIRIDVFGNRWENLKCRGRENLVLHEGYGKKALEALADTKISLNVMPWFKAGFQERVASAMLCGAVSLTDESTYINENFTSGNELVTYNLAEIEKLPGIIEKILNNDGCDAAEIAEAGRRAALAGHTWNHRAKELLGMIDEFNRSRS